MPILSNLVRTILAIRAIYIAQIRAIPKRPAAGVVDIFYLRIVIETDGHFADIQVVKGLGYGLDEVADRAVRAWRFMPATGRNGNLVPTTVTCRNRFPFEMTGP
jgi:TonB family protein